MKIFQQPEQNLETSGSQTANENMIKELLGEARISLDSGLASSTQAQKDNRWQVMKSDAASNTDTLKIKSVQNVSIEQFKKNNPGADLDHLDRSKIYNYKTYQSRLDPDWRLDGTNKDGTLRLSKEMLLTVNHRTDHIGLIETVGIVSDEFRRQVEDKINEIPEAKAMGKAGYKVVLAPTVIEGLPGLKGKSHPGWTQDFTHIDGTQDAELRLVVLGEYRIGDAGLREKARVNQPGHQLAGHGFDALGKDLQGKYLSETEEFLQEYREDMENWSDDDKKNKRDKDGDLTTSGYLSQPDGRGARETIASIFGMLTNGPENEGDDLEIARLFPRTVRYLGIKYNLPKWAIYNEQYPF